jgi:5-dehydro-4-deoxyglucarate dehydratase
MKSDRSPHDLIAAIEAGLLAFPLTDFDGDDRFDDDAYARRVEWLAQYGPACMFAAGGAGEFFSLTDGEYSSLVETTVGVMRGRDAPVIAATGYGTRKAVEMAVEAERLGADGLLVLPPYLTEGTQEGLRAHITAICRATGLGVFVYNRANCRLTSDTFLRLLDDCPTLVGFKDGIGDIEELQRIHLASRGRALVVNGMPTAEVYARAFTGMGVPTYSSAIFNFVPRSATRFQRAVLDRDEAFIAGFMTDFLLPYCRIRARHASYAVSIVKAGADAVGRSAGPVRPPLSMPTPAECQELAALIARLGPQD